MDDDTATEIQAIEDGMVDDFAAYEADPALKERYGALLEAKEAGTPAPAKPDAAAVRKGELERLMKDQTGPYWKGTKSARLQAEYRDLLGAERPAGDPRAVQLSDADVSTALDNLGAMGDAGAEWSAELAKGGAKGALQHGEDVRVGILGGMDAAGDVVQAFEGNLSENVKASVYRELANPYTPRLPPASRDDLAAFAAGGAGEILVKEWGAQAASKLAVALHRWDRLTLSLNDEEFTELDDFYLNRLTPTERASVLRQLAT